MGKFPNYNWSERIDQAVKNKLKLLLVTQLNFKLGPTVTCFRANLKGTLGRHLRPFVFLPNFEFNLKIILDGKRERDFKNCFSIPILTVGCVISIELRDWLGLFPLGQSSDGFSLGAHRVKK